MQVYDSGENMYSRIIEENKRLHLIEKRDIKNIKLTPKELENMEFANIGIEELINKYIDEKGNIYEKTNEDIYMYNINLNKIINKDMKFILIECKDA